MKSKGFTIIELLVVIVIIAVLAAVSIVSFVGIQQRAKTAASIATADMVASKATVWQTLEGAYPDLAQLRTNTKEPTSIDEGGGAAGSQEAKLGDPTQAIGADMNEVRSENGHVVKYEPCWGGDRFSGARITYWDFTESATKDRILGTCS